MTTDLEQELRRQLASRDRKIKRLEREVKRLEGEVVAADDRFNQQELERLFVVS